MKKVFIIGFFLFITGVPTAYAQTTSGGGCQRGYYCQPDSSYNSSTGVCSGTCVTGSSLPVNPNGTSNTSAGTNCQTGTFCPLAPIPGLTTGIQVNNSSDGKGITASMAVFLNGLYTFLIGLAAALAVIMIVWGGIEISTQDSVSKQSSGKDHIRKAIIGLILVLSPVLVFSMINKNIIGNLSTSFSPITPPSMPSGGTVASSTDPITKCSVQGTAGILQIATCPSGAAAQTWGTNNCSDGNLSTGPQNKLADGTITSQVELCAGKQRYGFISVTGITDGSFSGTINNMWPLAKMNDVANNGSSALAFPGICQTIGWRTCISDVTTLSSFTCGPPNVPTPTTSIPGGAWARCWRETLTCQDASSLNPTCDKSPTWQIFQ